MADMQFISEPIQIVLDRSDLSGPARGLTGTPKGFGWRGEQYSITEILDHSKVSKREGERPGADLYLKREHFVVLLGDGRTAEIYFERSASGSSEKARKQRWFLYTIEGAAG